MFGKGMIWQGGHVTILICKSAENLQGIYQYRFFMFGTSLKVNCPTELFIYLLNLYVKNAHLPAFEVC